VNFSTMTTAKPHGIAGIFGEIFSSSFADFGAYAYRARPKNGGPKCVQSGVF
jgi:hypothetical protein